MLFFYDPLLGLVAAVVAIPVALINRRLMRRSAGIFRALNDQSEREVSLIDEGSVRDVRRHFGVIAGHWNRLSDAEGISWGVVDVIALGLAVFALVRATGTSEEVGAIFATIAYVWAYIGGFDQVPGGAAAGVEPRRHPAPARRARRRRGERGPVPRHLIHDTPGSASHGVEPPDIGGGVVDIYLLHG